MFWSLHTHRQGLFQHNFYVAFKFWNDCEYTSPLKISKQWLFTSFPLLLGTNFSKHPEPVTYWKSLCIPHVLAIFFIKRVYTNFAICWRISVCNLIKNETLTHIFSYVFKNIYFTDHLSATAYGLYLLEQFWLNKVF